MPKFPEPPSPLAVPAAVSTIPAGTLLWRVYFTGGAHPATWNGLRFFGPTASRFDHHTTQPPAVGPRGILYAASGAHAGVTCLAEVFQASRVINKSAGAPWLTAFALMRDVRLLDLTGTWPTTAGASTAINSGPRPRARRWSQAIYLAYPALEGLLYSSSMNGNQPAIALYERALSALPTAPTFNRSLSDPAVALRIAAAAGRINYRIV